MASIENASVSQPDDGICAEEEQKIAAQPATEKIYRAGTLSYTLPALRLLFFWMLFGDFCLYLMESVVGVIPLQLRWSGAGDFLITLVTVTCPAVVGFVCTPIVGVQSDRYRGRLGRRRPFLLAITPLVVLSLAGLGLSKPLSAALYNLLPWGTVGLSEAGLLQALICFFACCFFIFNIYVINCFGFLGRDVIPQESIGTFVGLMRSVSVAGGFTFNRWLLGYSETHTFEIFLGSALVYALGFFLVIWKVKEGAYPPPEKKAFNPFHEVRKYARECYGHLFYWKFYGISVMFWAGFVPFMTYVVFFGTTAKQPGYAATLGLTLDEFGKMRGWTMAVQFPFFLLAGWLCDRLHPIRVLLFGTLFTAMGYFCGYFLSVSTSGLFISLSLIAVGGAFALAGIPSLGARILPALQFGQFSSANNVIFQFSLIFIPLGAAWLLGLFKDYRLLFFWASFFNLLSFLCTVSLFKHWKKLGGDKNYSPPVYEHVPAPPDSVRQS